MKRILLVTALSTAFCTGSNAQKATGKTTPEAVSIVIESPVDSSLIQPFLKTMRQHPRSKEAAEAHLAIAKQQYANRAYNVALEDLRKIAQDYPKGSHSEEAAFYLTAALAHTNNHEETILEAKKALAENPNDTWNAGELYFLGRAYFALGKSDKAISALDQVVNDHPNSPYRNDALRVIVDTYRREKQYDNAITSLQRVVAESKDRRHRHEAQLQTAWIHSTKGDIETAVAEYRKAADMDAAIAARAGYETAYMYLNRGDYVKAKEEFQKVEKRYSTDPYGARASFRVGYCLAESGAYESALRQLTKTDTTYPNFEQRDRLLYYKAISYGGLEKLELIKLTSSEFKITDSVNSKTKLNEYLLWYVGILDKRMEHLGQAKLTLQELIERYPKSSLIKAAYDIRTQTESTMKELKDELSRTKATIKQIENGIGAWKN